ncbi:polyketide cyclase [Chromatiales bacterium (ex Bugula neritina AB1)]|nr:polyketide cyclase [Chromatiales bacterium (ex Bugula neritina AB1)]
MSPKEVVLAFWESMRSNDFYAASKWLTDDFEGHWPQSSEIIAGRDNFAAVNSAYPENGLWEFDLQSIVCEGNSVVTDVSITDGVQRARAITFHTVRGQEISKQVEYWPDDYAAPEWRSQWVVRQEE